MLEEHGGLPLPLSEQSAPPDRQELWQCPQGAPSGLGGEPVSVAQVPHRLPLGEPLSRAASFFPSASGLTPVGWAAAVGPEPGCVAGAGAAFVPGASVSGVPKGRSHLVSSPLGSIGPFIGKRGPGLGEVCALRRPSVPIGVCGTQGAGLSRWQLLSSLSCSPVFPTTTPKARCRCPRFAGEDPGLEERPVRSHSRRVAAVGFEPRPVHIHSWVFCFFFLPFYPPSLLCCSPQTKPISGISHFKGIWDVTWGLSGRRIAFSPNLAEGDLARTRKVAGTRGRD